MLCIYTMVRFLDLLHRGALGLLSKPGWEAGLFLLEIFLVSVAPISLLLSPKVRESSSGLYLASVLCLLGFVTNRMNVAITGMEAASRQHYVPKWTEIAVTLSITAFGFFVFALAVNYLPIFTHEVASEPVAQIEAVETEVPELSNVQT
jgi:Ni/Fe-hydrogenase subunit HybB-like protein